MIQIEIYRVCITVSYALTSECAIGLKARLFSKATLAGAGVGGHKNDLQAVVDWDFVDYRFLCCLHWGEDVDILSIHARYDYFGLLCYLPHIGVPRMDFHS